MAFAIFPPSSLRGEDFADQVEPLMRKYCYGCHSGQGESDVRLDQLSLDFIQGGDADNWHDALNQLDLGHMPPEEATQPDASERAAITGWIRRSLRAAAEAKRAAGGRVTARRLTRDEYDATMRQLLGVDDDFSRELPPEPASPDGFLNDGATLEMSPSQIEAYLSAARRGLELAIVDGSAPEVHRYEASQTAVGKLPRRKDGGVQPVNPEFLLDVRDFPRRGEFEIQVTASAIVPPGEGNPQIEVSLGCVPGIVHVPRKRVGLADVTASDSPQTFTFRGRMEDFPQSGDREFGNVAFKGVIVLLDYWSADGRELRYPSRSYTDPTKPKKKKAASKNAPKDGAKDGAIDGAKGAGKNSSTPLLPPRETPQLEIIVHRVAFRSPTFTQWPPRSHRQLLGDSERWSDETERARAVLSPFLRRAFRRPPSNQEMEQRLALFDRIRSRSPSYLAALRETMATVLVSPHFLYLPQENDAHSLASRLSYLLTGTMPDEALSRLADDGQLLNPEVVRQQTLRLLADPRRESLVRPFVGQWLDLDALDRVAVNPEYFPDFDEQLKADMREETVQFISRVLEENRSCTELIESDWTMANRRLAGHYQLKQKPSGARFDRVALRPEDHRGGLLGHGSFLVSNSTGADSHPIKRAVWVLDRLLASPPASPPPDVPDLDAERADLRGLTVKQQLELHREKESCNQCHRNIDPWGIALERFDAVGQFRTAPTTPVARSAARRNPRSSNAAVLDAETVLPDGRKLDGAPALKRYLLEHRRDALARSIVERLATYALGRQLDFADDAAITALTTEFIQNDLRLQDLVVQLTTSELFRLPRSDSR